MESVNPAGGSDRATDVLVADDNVDAADVLAVLLGECGYAVQTAYDGLAAMKAAEALRPRAAVLDIKMPGASGHDVARWIRRQPWGAETLLIALTAYGSPADRALTRDAGFDLHLVKPASPAELLEALRPPGAFQAEGSEVSAPV